MGRKHAKGKIVLLLLYLFILSGNVWGHDFWIEASPFNLQKKGHLDLQLFEGVKLKGNSLPYIDDWFKRFELIDADGERLVDSILGSDPAARIRLRTPGITWALYQSVDSYVELEPKKFISYLKEEGMDAAIPLWQQSGLADKPARELFQRCAKALLWQPGENDRLLDKPLGLPLEIIPLNNPHRLTSDQTLRIKVLYEGEPIQGVTVMALNRANLETKLTAKTNAKGEAAIDLKTTGTWLVKAVHMIQINDAKADWKSYWASLTFELGEPELPKQKPTRIGT